MQNVGKTILHGAISGGVAAAAGMLSGPAAPVVVPLVAIATRQALNNASSDTADTGSSGDSISTAHTGHDHSSAFDMFS